MDDNKNPSSIPVHWPNPKDRPERKVPKGIGRYMIGPYMAVVGAAALGGSYVGGSIAMQEMKAVEKDRLQQIEADLNAAKEFLVKWETMLSDAQFPVEDREQQIKGTQSIIALLDRIITQCSQGVLPSDADCSQVIAAGKSLKEQKAKAEPLPKECLPEIRAGQPAYWDHVIHAGEVMEQVLAMYQRQAVAKR